MTKPPSKIAKVRPTTAHYKNLLREVTTSRQHILLDDRIFLKRDIGGNHILIGDVGSDHIITRLQWKFDNDVGGSHVIAWRFEKLIADLQCPIDVHGDHTTTGEIVKWREGVVYECERIAADLAAFIQRAPDGVPERDLAELRELLRCAELARGREQLRLRSVENPRHRPDVKGRSRDYLAQKAKEIIERYCGPLPPPDLRRAVAAVLEHAGADFIKDFTHEPTKFDAMFAEPAIIDVGPKALEARDNEPDAREERLAPRRF
jgi:hypothetical protein